MKKLLPSPNHTIILLNSNLPLNIATTVPILPPIPQNNLLSIRMRQGFSYPHPLNSPITYRITNRPPNSISLLNTQQTISMTTMIPHNQMAGLSNPRHKLIPTGIQTAHAPSPSPQPAFPPPSKPQTAHTPPTNPIFILRACRALTHIIHFITTTSSSHTQHVTPYPATTADPLSMEAIKSCLSARPARPAHQKSKLSQSSPKTSRSREISQPNPSPLSTKCKHTTSTQHVSKKPGLQAMIWTWNVRTSFYSITTKARTNLQQRPY